MNGEHVATNELSAADRAAMFALLNEHFEGVTPAQFDADLNGKGWVVLVRDGANILVGFSTLAIEDVIHDGRACTMVYSGDTIVAASARQSMEFPRAWIRAVRTIRPFDPHKPLYWLLLTSGFRTYRLMSVFWREFYPRHDREMPADVCRLLAHAALARYGQLFDAPTGIVRFACPQRLRVGAADLPEPRLADPHIRYFVERNPGHVLGDELVCIADLDDSNLTRAGRRMVAGDAIAAERLR